MKLSTLATATASVVTAAAFAAGSAAPATGASSLTCTGNLKATTVRASVVVPAGATCTMTKTVVQGGISVNDGARLVLSGATVRDGITSAGRLSGNGPAQGRPSSLNITGGQVRGVVAMRGTTATISGAKIGGLTGLWNHAVTVTGSVVSGAVSLSRNDGGNVTLCGNDFGASVAVVTSKYAAFVGTAQGGAACAGNTFRSDLTVNAMQGVRLSGNLVNGNASGVNIPFMAAVGIVGAHNTFAGSTTGDFATADLAR